MQSKEKDGSESDSDSESNGSGEGGEEKPAVYDEDDFDEDKPKKSLAGLARDEGPEEQERGESAGVAWTSAETALVFGPTHCYPSKVKLKLDLIE